MQFDHGFSDGLPYPDGSFDRVLSAMMFHHLLSLDEKIKTLSEVRRVLTPGGSFHLLDFDGGTAHSGGHITRLLHRHRHRTEHLKEDSEDRIPTLMREAGFTDPRKIAHRHLRIGAQVAYYEASTPKGP